MDQYCRTRTEKKTFSYEWIISNFSALPEKPGECISSSTFKSTDIYNCNLNIDLYPKGKTAETKEYIGLFLTSNKDNPLAQCTLRYVFCLQNKKGEPLVKSVRGTHEGGSWGKTQLVKRDLISGRLPNDELVIVCTLIVHKEVQYDTHTNYIIPECRVTDDLGQLLFNEDLSDINMSVNGKVFKAHKAILAARSPVFAAMFKHDMEETRSNLVNISEIDTEVFQQLLQFIYTGSCSNLETFSDKLLDVSDKYQLDRLKAMCEQSLGRNLTEDNAADTLALAELHNAQQLTKVAVSFIISNYAGVKQTEGWKSMKISPTLQLLFDQAVSTTSSSRDAKRLKRSF